MPRFCIKVVRRMTPQPMPLSYEGHNVIDVDPTETSVFSFFLFLFWIDIILDNLPRGWSHRVDTLLC